MRQPKSVPPPDAPSAAPGKAPPEPNLAGFGHLLVIYAVWSSTYLAIRVAVRTGSGFPPFTMAGSRALAAACIVLAWAAFRGGRLRLPRRDVGLLAVSGLMLWVGGNGLVTWAEQRAPSGFAALLVGSIPIWVALMEAVLDRRLPSRRLAASLLVGLSGVALLASPSLGVPAEAASTLALVAAPMIWAGGVVLQHRRPVEASPFVSAGVQMLAGSAGFLVLILATGEPAPHPSSAAWTAWAYLVLIGSVLAFTSFVQVLRLLPTSIGMTYAYVNPVFAALLGWWLLGEQLTWQTLIGGALVVLGIAGVFHDRYGSLSFRALRRATGKSPDSA